MRFPLILAGVACSVFAVSSAFAAAPERPIPAEIQFNRDVRPILSNNCFACHGPDHNKREAELRLDVEEDAKKAHDGRAAIVAGKVAESELVKRLLHSDPEERMPPASTGKTLTQRKIDVLRRWIEQGAKYQPHWSLVPQGKVPAPAGMAGGTPIDRFIEARLQAEGLTPVAQADKRTLLRRLYFDLIGLPPSPAEMDAFIADASPAAYEKAVDRLLESPQYGERLAIYWLDLVRYADTCGIHSDNHQDHAPYRDYVIHSFNSNKPFDQFTVEQLAGDLIPNSTVEQRIASGYNRLNLTTEEGGAQAKEYLAKYSGDRVRNVSGVWMGYTLGCAECHDHKFDPFTTKDFYTMAAFFADVQEAAVGRQAPVKLPTKGQDAKIAALEKQIADLQTKLHATSPELEAAQAKWEGSLKTSAAPVPKWVSLKPEKAESSGKSNLAIQPDAQILSTGANPPKDHYTLTLKTDLANITAVRLEAFADPSFPAKGLGRGNGNFVLTRFEAEVGGQLQKLTSAKADFSQDGFDVAGAIDDNPATGWAISGHEKPANHVAMFVLEKPISGGAGTVVTIRMKHESQFAAHNIGRFRLSLTTEAKPELSDQPGFPPAVAEGLAIEPAKRNDAQRNAVAAHFRSLAAELKPLRDELARQQGEKKGLEDSFEPILVTQAMSPRMIRILPRGNWLDDSGEVVEPAIPGVLGKLAIEGKRATRLDLAKWLTTPNHPLTSRVFVNRVWKLLFGQGLVKSLNDFGSQGAQPSHPELLDWVASDFVENKWDVKRLMKSIVMTQAYRRASVDSPELRERDPYNVLLARQGRFRLDAELVRDNALAISGLLSKTIGGPSVKPYQPAGYWAYLNFPTREWQKDAGENVYRRGLYTYWCRTFPHPSLIAFDAPSREECIVERPRSNTPLSALVLLNDPTYVEAARTLAERILKEGGAEPAQRIAWAYRQVVQRAPTEEETKLLVSLVARHLAQYQQDTAAADALIKIGDRPVPADQKPAELAAWTSLARVLLNLHETITRN